MYRRTVWHKRGVPKEELGTDALALDVPVDKKDSAINILHKLKWGLQYKGAAFIPFRKSTVLTDEHQKKAIEAQNEYLRCTHTKVIELKNNCVLTMHNGKPVLFAEWIANCTVNNAKFLQHVEVLL